MNAEAKEISSQEEGPASLREALLESYDESLGDEQTELESTESTPTDEITEPADSADDEAVEAQGDEPSDDETVIQAPEHWSDEDRAMFDELPSDAREYILKREKQYEKGIQEKSERLSEFEKVFEPYEPYLQMRGISKSQAMQIWIAAQRALDTDPVSAIRRLAETYGEEVVEQLFGASEKTGSDEYRFSDPELDRARNELKSEKRKLEEENYRLQSERQQQAVMEIQKFRSAVDDNGNPKYPFFDQSVGSMRALLASGEAVSLEDAYDKAVWLIPEFREEHEKTLLTRKQQEESKKREQAANKAKKVAKSVNGKGSKPPPPPKRSTLRDELASAYDASLRGEL